MLGIARQKNGIYIQRQNKDKTSLGSDSQQNNFCSSNNAVYNQEETEDKQTLYFVLVNDKGWAL